LGFRYELSVDRMPAAIIGHHDRRERRVAVCGETAARISAQNTPLRVRLIEPFGAGGGPDIVARALARPLSECWGRPVDVENHPGAGSTAAPGLVANAPGDGSTLLVNTSAHAYSAAAASDLPYDPLGDFVAVTPLTSQAYVLVAGGCAGVKNLSQLIAAAKSHPGTMRFGSTGAGTGTHVGTEELNLAVGIAAVHVPAGPADAISDVVSNVVSGVIDYVMSPISIAAPHLGSGNLVALGVTTAQRSPALPEVPTLAEAGAAGYDFPIWYGVWAPAGTPPGIVARLAEDITAALVQPDVNDWLVTHGMEPMSMTPQAFARFVVDETRRAAHILDTYANTQN
jgi:tripartite-type tricarboxylate transporter receptor subunit TctC